MLIDRLTPISTDQFWDHPLKVVMGGLFLALVAPIELFSGTEIPVTLQTLVVLLLGFILGPWRGAMAVLLYLGLGALGLPVFAEGNGGWKHLFGPTGGFLWSFVLVAGLVGWCAQRSWGQFGWRVPLIWLLAHGLIILLGGIWLGCTKGFEGLWSSLLDLWPGLLLKSVVGTVLTWGSNRLMRYLIANREGNRD
ncbi:MAG: biotin transporter BioY [Bacteroidota bacterium]